MVIDPLTSKIAVIGAGISGIVAAHYLSQRYQVTLFEQQERLGGHTNTRQITYGSDRNLAVDTGFIVCNQTNYPFFYRFLSELCVPLRDTNMSFGFYSEQSRLHYVGPALHEFLSTPLNFVNVDFCRMLLEQRRFNAQVLRDLKNGQLQNMTIGEYIKKHQISKYFVDHYLSPLIASIWSSPDILVENFPALTFAVFFKNHGMLELNKRPRWQTVIGGSASYLKAFEASFTGTIRKSVSIRTITRSDTGATIYHQNGREEQFDKVVIATHADEALALLGDADSKETRLLKSWSYSQNRTVLHTDISVLPPRRRLWAAWNYRQKKSASGQAGIVITYYMNRLQGLKSAHDYFITLNPDSTLDTSKILYETTYSHPIYTPASIASQSEIQKRNGERNTYFCGAYLGYGFHEDGVKSALNVALALGVSA